MSDLTVAVALASALVSGVTGIIGALTGGLASYLVARQSAKAESERQRDAARRDVARERAAELRALATTTVRDTLHFENLFWGADPPVAPQAPSLLAQLRGRTVARNWIDSTKTSLAIKAHNDLELSMAVLYAATTSDEVSEDLHNLTRWLESRMALLDDDVTEEDLAAAEQPFPITRALMIHVLEEADRIVEAAG